MLKKCMYLNPAGQWAFYGKTGTGRNHNRDLLEAWFVGFAENEKGERVVATGTSDLYPCRLFD